MSSSPRDQIQTCEARLTICARMPSYFHSTIQSAGRREPGREFGRREVELVGEEERIGLAEIGRPGAGLGGELQIALGARRDPAVGVAHHALRHPLGVDAGAFGERALHEQLADSDAKAAADQLVEKKAPGAVELVPVRGDARRLLLGRQAAQGSRRSSTQSARPRSLSCAGGGSTAATVSAKSPTA